MNEMNMFPTYVFEKPHKGVLKSSEQCSFSQDMIDLRGHMPKFSLKNECFPTYPHGDTP